MATPNTTSDTMPTPWDGENAKNGNPNPVALVATVVARNTAVQPSQRFPASKPASTTRPEPIPTRLTATCTNVNVVIPKIMERSLKKVVCGDQGPGRSPRRAGRVVITRPRTRSDRDAATASAS